MKSEIAGIFLSVLLLLVKTSKCSDGDTDMMNVSDEDITSKARDNSTMNASDEDEDPEIQNVRRILDKDDDVVIIVWKMEKYEPVLADITDYSELITDHAYVILQGKSKVKPENWKIFYWVGDNSSEEDAVNAALFAYVLDSIVHPVANFRREAEGRESPHFRALFEFAGIVESLQELPSKIAAEGNSPMTDDQVHATNDDHNTKMILIEGWPVSTVQEVEFSMNYLEKNDICIVAYNSQAVYVYCGRKTMYEAHKFVAKRLARMILQKSESTLRVLQIIHPPRESDEAQPLDPLVDEFKRIFKAIENEKATSERNEKKARVGEKVDILLTRIYQDKYDAVREEIDDKPPVGLYPFLHENSFVLDTCLTDVGMVVWLSHVSEVDEREGAVRKAESLIKERTHCGSRPVIFVDETNKRIRSTRKRERYLFSHLANFVELMQKLNFSWEHFYEIRELDAGVLLTASSREDDSDRDN